VEGLSAGSLLSYNVLPSFTHTLPWVPSIYYINRIKYATSVATALPRRPGFCYVEVPTPPDKSDNSGDCNGLPLTKLKATKKIDELHADLKQHLGK
jgi:hypothetical protein